MEHISSSGKVLSSDQVPPAFCHFTFNQSENRLIITNIQGTHRLFSNPVAHSVNQIYGSFDEGEKGVNHFDTFSHSNLQFEIFIQGITSFLQQHVCNGVCNLLNLKQLNLDSADSANKGDEDEMEMLLRSEEMLKQLSQKLESTDISEAVHFPNLIPQHPPIRYRTLHLAGSF